MSLAPIYTTKGKQDSASVPKAFQFIDGRPGTARQPKVENKENELENRSEKPLIGSQENILMRGLDVNATPFPSTPATRLPLADLIGNTDDSNTLTSKAGVLPDEQILWHPLRSPIGTCANKTPAQRKNKRARSSSPSSSPFQGAAGNAVYGPGLLSGKPNLRTPQADPAADLWNRYAINAGKEGGSVVRNISFTDLMVASSPYLVDDQASNIGGLRRWTSCGKEWPSSKSKRRKIKHSPNKNDAMDVFQDDADTPKEITEQSKRFRVGSLLERIQESLTRPVEQLESLDSKAPSSSSPLPDKGGWNMRSDLSPSRVDHESPIVIKQKQNLSKMEKCVERENNAPSSDSFGSGEIDLAALEEVESKVSADVQIPDLPSNSAREVDHLKLTGDPHANNAKSNTTTKPFEEEDEFGDCFSLEDLDETILDAVPDGLSEGNPLHIGKRCRENTTEPAKNEIDEDDFGDDDIDEATLIAAEIAATQSYQTNEIDILDNGTRTRTIQRYLITNVVESEYVTNAGHMQPEKVLLVEDEKTKLNKAITLRQSWLDTRCTKGSYVHVIGTFGNSGHCIVDDARNMLILHPDHLISALVVADSFGCMRRAVLQDRIKATSEPSPPQFYGTILHELFQQCLEANTWDTDFINDLIQKTLTRHIEDLYDVKLDFAQATEHLRSKMPALQAWAEVFVRAKPVSNGQVKDRGDRKVNMSIDKLLDVEEHVWSPMYGLKGNIDATVQAVVQDDEGEHTLTVPFEVKTGKNSSVASHRAQTALYTLLLSDRYDVAIAYGILYYLETSETLRIPAIRHEIRHMVMQRNELACYVRERLSLPPMLRNTHACNQCFAKAPCFLYHKLVEGGDGETSGLRDKFDKLAGHLKPIHQQFFQKWDTLLTKEETEMMKFRRELWTMLSTEREKLGRCFANVVLDPGFDYDEQSNTKINKYRYTFRKQEGHNRFSFTESQMVAGDPIVISDENGHYALAKGFVASVQKNHITVTVDRRLHNARKKCADFDENTNQAFSGIMQVKGAKPYSPASGSSETLLYRLDKDEFSNGLATVRNNLVQIMTDDVFHAREIRKLIVEGDEPRFKPSLADDTTPGPLSQRNLNEDQRAAIEKIMAAEDYALVLGMPGTGKTTTIAHIIRALVAKGKSVLLTSYTHTAVDNILLKIREDNIGVLRLGALAKVHPEVREFAVLAAEPKASIEELQKAYHEPQVVATTCLGINHQVFNERIFDYCIVDEASQITLPVCLGPIRMAKTFILVGDHYQLPPLVQNRAAQEGGLDISLFKLLSERHPSAVATLHHQYRMNKEIMSISNNLIYGGRLKCGSEATAAGRLEVPNRKALQLLHHDKFSQIETADASKICVSAEGPDCWLARALAPESSPVVFINTDTVLPHSREIAQGARITNPFEAKIVTQVVHAMLHMGIPVSAMGVITLYRSQLALIKSELQHTPFQSLSNQPPSTFTQVFPEQIEAHTTDRFQGRDKNVILLSCVRNNDRDVVGDLLRDWRRVNVAVTRARSKLIIIGSKGTLSRGDELLGKLIKLCDQENWILDLPVRSAEEECGVREHWWGEGVVRDVLPEIPTVSETGSMQYKSGTSTRYQQQHSKAANDATATTTTTAGTGAAAATATSSLRKPLAPTSGNGSSNRTMQKPFKMPSKIGKMTEKGVLGSNNIRAKRPVLADIVNDILGEGNFD